MTLNPESALHKERFFIHASFAFLLHCDTKPDGSINHSLAGGLTYKTKGKTQSF